MKPDSQQAALPEYFEMSARFHSDPRVKLIKAYDHGGEARYMMLALIAMGLTSVEGDAESGFAVNCRGTRHDVASVARELEEPPDSVARTLALMTRFDINGIVADLVRWPEGGPQA